MTRSIILAFLATSIAFGQSAPSAISADLTTLQADLAKAVADAAIPAPVDPVLTLLKASPQVYFDLQQCLAQSNGCIILAAIYECPKPAAWIPSTQYTLGAYVTDAAGNVYRLSAIDASASPAPVSGPATPIWVVTVPGALTADASFTWVLYSPSASVWTCSASGSIPVGPGAAKTPVSIALAQ